MRIMVTGASGFIGSRVVRALAAAEHQIVVVSRTERQKISRLQEIESSLNYIQGDLNNLSSIRDTILEWRPEVCVHLAWYTEPGRYLESTNNLISLSNTLSLIQLLSEAGCRKFVGAGSCAEYDANWGYLREDGPTHPETLYAAAKLSCLMLAQQLTSALSMDFVWGRIFYLYGPLEDARRIVPAAIHSLWRKEMFPATSGEQRRDYLHVDDVALAFRYLIENQVKGIVNIASGDAVRIRTLLEIIGRRMGALELVQFGALPSREWDPPFICGDNRRLLSLGWKPRYDLTTGIEQSCNWWREQLETNR